MLPSPPPHISEDLRGARVFVTGGTGFLGRTIVRDLTSHGAEVRALAWTDECEATLHLDGAKAFRGNLTAPASLAPAIRGCDLAIHAAGHMRVWGDLSTFRLVNVEGARAVVSACREAGVRRLVHVSAAAVVMGPQPVVDVNESAAKHYPTYSHYIRTKSEAEDVVLSKEGAGLEIVIVRPPGIWGAGDPYFLPKIADAVVRGAFKWIDQGDYPFSVCHVQNVSECILLALTRGSSRSIYFASDNDTPRFRDLLCGLLATLGLPQPQKSMPFRDAWALASILETSWKILRLRSEPPVTRSMLKLTGQAFSVKSDKARSELGYLGHVTRAQGLALLANSGGKETADAAYRNH